MNFLSYLGPAKNELDLAIKDAGHESLEEYMASKQGLELSTDERIAYHIGRMNLIAEILTQLRDELGDEEE